MSVKPSFVVATPGRTVCDDNARVWEKHGMLRFIALGTRRGTSGIPSEHTRLNPAIGLVSYIGARLLPAYAGESFRFRLLPWFDQWVKKQLRPGDHILSSYGYTNQSFRWVRQHGGKTFLDAGNSHPQNFWDVMLEEHRRWKSPYPPIPPHWYRRSLAMMEEVDYVLCPSSYVRNSFLQRGFAPKQILKNVYPLDLNCFSPPTAPRPKERPLTLISTGSLSLRKGTPYLLEAFRQIRQQVPDARLFLNRAVADSARPAFAEYSDLPIDWSPNLPHAQLAERLRAADIFLLPSLEDGFARTVAEALACGLPTITTPNTGASDLIVPGVNGEVVPIRDPEAIASAVLAWWERIRLPEWQSHALVESATLSFETFERDMMKQLQKIGLA